MMNEEIVLMYQTTSDPDRRRELLAELYENNIGLIGLIVTRSHYDVFEDREDLMQQAFFGLVEAAERWSPDGGAGFAHYSAHWIRQALRRYLDECGNVIRLPSHMVDAVVLYQHTLGKFASERQRKPSDDELMYLLNWSEKQLQAVREAEKKLRVASMSAPIGEDGSELADLIADPADLIAEADDRIQQEELRGVMWDVVNDLRDREAEVIRMRFKDGKTLAECSADLHVAPERVRQLEKKGLRNLRRPEMADRLLPYLDDLAEVYAHNASGIGIFRRTGTSAVERAVLASEQIADARSFRKKKK